MTDDLGLSAYEVLTTTRSVRKRLDFDRPVDRQVILDCIDIAQQAPTGSNSQMWHWVVVTEPRLKSALAELYSETADPYLAAASAGPGFKAGDVRAERAGAVQSSAAYLNEHLAEVPAMVIPCQWGRLEPGTDNSAAAGYYGSILPAVWSFMLALRSRGLGSAWTTLHLPKEQEAAELLGIPYDRVTQVGLFPVAHTKGTDFKLASRIPAADLTHWDRW
jgi:nitroreductase